LSKILDTNEINQTISYRSDKIVNWNLLINTSHSIGCRIYEIKTEELTSGKIASICKIVWIIMKYFIDVRIKRDKAILNNLLNDKERIIDTYLWNTEDILCRFVNFTLKDIKVNVIAKSIINDFKDCYLYIKLFSLLNDDADHMLNKDSPKKIEFVVTEAAKLGCFITPSGIENGKYWQNFTLLFYLYILLTKI